MNPPTTPCDEPLFILASAQRCGSTLLQRLLNSRADTLIWGEHQGVLNGFASLHKDLMAWESRFAGNRKEFLMTGCDLFLPNMVPEDHELRSAAIAYVLNLFGVPAARLGKSRWGFKEVRYGADVLVFLKGLFPKARFIHLTRDPAACFRSMKHWELGEDDWDRAQTERSMWDWQRINCGLLEMREYIPRMMFVRFEDMVGDPAAFIERLAGFLGASPEEFDAGVFERRLDGNFGKPVADGRLDLTADEAAFLADPAIAGVAEQLGYPPGAAGRA
ncbi:sulfotransferase family protein [Luteolibacter marinus]|uniref:sulfotransferase family protein n=1 Tax=Luteolibacter marinus TaxID=2776705 RepID=UPI001869562F|nr:sulfotransferase [Luteolibacter marinus]